MKVLRVSTTTSRPARGVTGTDTWVLRVDHNFNDKHRIFGRFSGRQSEASSTGLGEENVAFPAQSVSSTPRRSGLISLTSVFAPTLLAELRLSYTRLQFNDYYADEGFELSSVGFPQSLSDEVQYKTFPLVSISQYTVGTGLSVTGGSTAEVGDLNGAGKNYTPQDTWHLQYHVTWLRNRHKVKFGTDLQLLRLSTFNTIAPAGRYSLTASTPRAPIRTPAVLRPDTGLPASCSECQFPATSALARPCRSTASTTDSMYRTTLRSRTN